MAIIIMRIKSSIFTALLILISTTLASQSYNKPPNLPSFDLKKWHFGFTVGPEFQNIYIGNSSEDLLPFFSPTDIPRGSTAIYYYSEVPQISPGFNVGIIVSRRLGEYFNLRMIPSLSLGQKTIKSQMFYKNSSEIILNDNIAPIETKIKSTYIACPILIKYKAVRIQDMRPYLIGGVNFKHDLSTDDKEAISLKPLDTSLEFGIGSDFYLQEFRFGIELRFGLGLFNLHQTNVTAHDSHPYLRPSIQEIKAKTFTIAFNFE